MAFVLLPRLHNWFLRQVLDGTPTVLQLQLQRNPGVTGLAHLFFDLGAEITYVALLPLLAWNLDLALGRRLALLWALGFYVTKFLKALMKLPRPYHVNDYISNIERRRGESFGLPCSKAFTAACLPLYVVLATQGQSTPILALLLVFLWCSAVTASRIYLGTHTPADMIAGLCLGLCFAILWLHCGEVVDKWVIGSAGMLDGYVIACGLGLLAFPHPPFFGPDITELAMVMGYSVGWLLGGKLQFLVAAFLGTASWTLPPSSGWWPALARAGVGLILLAQVRENVEPRLGRVFLAKPIKVFRPCIDANTEAILKHSHARHLLLGLFADYLPVAVADAPPPPAEAKEPKAKEAKATIEDLPSPPDEPESMYPREAWQRKASTAVPVYAVTYVFVGLTASFGAPLLIHVMGI